MLKLNLKTATIFADRIMTTRRQILSGGIQIWVYTSKTTGSIVAFHHTGETTPYRMMVGRTDIVPNPPAQEGTGDTVREALIAALTQEQP